MEETVTISRSKYDAMLALVKVYTAITTDVSIWRRAGDDAVDILCGTQEESR